MLHKLRQSLWAKIMVIITSMVLLPLILLSIVWGDYIFSQIYTRKIENAKVLSYQVAGSLNRTIHLVSSWEDILAKDRQIMQITSYTISESKYVDYINKSLKPKIEMMTSQEKSISNIRILHDNPDIFNVNNLIYYTEDFDERLNQLEQYHRHIDEDSGIVYYVNYMEKGYKYNFTHFSKQDQSQWYVYYPVIDSWLSRPSALIEVSLDQQDFNQLMSSLVTHNEIVALFSEDGSLISATEEISIEELANSQIENSDVMHVTISGKRYVAVAQPVEYLFAYLVLFIPESEFSLSPSQWIVILISLLVFFSGMLIVGRYFSKRVLRRITDLTWYMKNQDIQEITLPDYLFGEDEAGQMAVHYQKMIERLRISMEKERALVYSNLIHQLRPHFICNAMDMLRIQAERAGNQSLAHSAVLINDFFRYVMIEDGKWIPLIEEINNTRNYLDLVNEIYNNEVRYHIMMDAWVEQHAASMLVPGLIIQPIVENAIRHGISGRKYGYVKIEIRQRTHGIQIKVSDNGSGIPKDRLRELNEKLSNKNTLQNDGNHIGLTNVIRRLRFAFSDQCRLYLESENEGGTTVIIEIDDILLK